MKRVSDILVDELIRAGLNQLFMVTGGGAMHLNDAFGRRRGDLKITFNHHEQACAMAAEGYCRLSGRPAIVNVTTGPGGINALNGVYGAYVDSIAMVVISGQIKRETMAKNFPIPLRQLGDQEVDIIPIVKTVTKSALELQDPLQVKVAVQKAVYLCCHGRPGPVWIDVPIDVQSALVDENSLPEWKADDKSVMALRGDAELSPNTLCDFDMAGSDQIVSSVDEIFARMKSAKRPLLYGGSGVRTSGCADDFRRLASQLGIPAVVGWHAVDDMPNDHPSFAGKPGMMGDRAGNFAVQNADFILTLGCRLSIRQVSYNWQSFAPRAWIAQVDVDSAELRKPTLHTDLSLHADLRSVMPVLLKKSAQWKQKTDHEQFRLWCRERVSRYPVLQQRQIDDPLVNPYFFVDRLYKNMAPDDVLITGNGSACVIGLQSALVREKTRVMTNSGDASMGYDLPASIGAAATGMTKRVICLTGDGSIMMNLQELQTIAGNKIPVIVFLINNNGYLSIRITQTTYFSDNIFGVGPDCGVTLPDFGKVASAFGIPYIRIDKKENMEKQIRQALNSNGPLFCEVMVNPKQFFEPKLQSRQLANGTMVSPALDDMAPFLTPEELAGNRLQ